MRTLLETKEWANALVHSSRAKMNRPNQWPILSPGMKTGPIYGPFFSWRVETGPIKGPFFSWRVKTGPIKGPFFSWRMKTGPIIGPFFLAPPPTTHPTHDTPLAGLQGKEPTKAPRSIPSVQEDTRGKGRVRGTCDAPGCRRGADIVCSPSMSRWNPPALVWWATDCLDCFLRQSTPKHPPAQIGALSPYGVRAPRRLAASHVFASLKRLGRGAAPTPRGGLRCALAARCVHAWEGRA